MEEMNQVFVPNGVTREVYKGLDGTLALTLSTNGESVQKREFLIVL